jgi:hypothetical protein
MPGIPSPATVVMMPVVASTHRMRKLAASAIKRPPAASSATSNGQSSSALVAGPPSPLKPPIPAIPFSEDGPMPATVVMMPVAAVTLRIRLLPVSEI